MNARKSRGVQGRAVLNRVRKARPTDSGASRRTKHVTSKGARRSPAATPVIQRDSTNVDTSSVFTLPKLFLLSGYLVGTAVVIMCAMDLALAVPFSRANTLFDVGFLFSGIALLYLSWNARDACH